MTLGSARARHHTLRYLSRATSRAKYLKRLIKTSRVTSLRARAHWPLCSTTCGRALWRRHVCYVCKRSVCGGDEPQPVAHLSHKLQCARQSLKIMVSYGNKYPRHNARPHVVEQSGQCARALIVRNWTPPHLAQTGSWRGSACGAFSVWGGFRSFRRTSYAFK